MIRPAAALLVNAAVVGAALAQSGAAITVPQLSQSQRIGAAQIEGDAGSTSARSRAESVSSPVQVGSRSRSTESAPALSNSAQGRSVGVTALGGRDRCNPALAGSDTEACRRRIETRSGDYARVTAAPVTAEGRLLLLTQNQPPPMTPDSAARRLAGSPAELETLAGTAAGQLAGVLSQPTTQPDAAPNAGQPLVTPFLTALPPGAAPVIVAPPR